ncbi:PREDICTED: F-box/LRR-repeat protein 2-like isoform X3 [Vollenhovia emeryi]|uniref:F-box/LRR-repeat protein 2-like isoform X3 n=1 Tax=Vollenhovia emeryi TaxID=411798 RepID=UPI0005F382AD|nr:PREDICTED: F-box/LRR-repeat protein 2-like isoform X3 [Vollenhovia emeryi]
MIHFGSLTKNVIYFYRDRLYYILIEMDYTTAIDTSDTGKSSHQNEFEHKQEYQDKDDLSSKQQHINHHSVNFKNAKCIEDIESYVESKKEPCNGFVVFPDELLLLILEKLDVRSLCRISCVNKCINDLTNKLFYKLLKFRNKCSHKYMHIINNNFASRCKYLREVHFTCVADSHFSSHFVNFLEICGSGLTHLRLILCKIDDFALHKISTICKNLREKTHRLRSLMLDETPPLKINILAVQLKDLCPNLEMLSFTGFITSDGIDALAECKNLQKIQIGNITYRYVQNFFVVRIIFFVTILYVYIFYKHHKIVTIFSSMREP